MKLISEALQGLELFQRSSGPVAMTVPTWWQGVPQRTDYDAKTYAEEGYRRNVIIFACVDIRAWSMTQTEFRCVQTRAGETTPLDVQHDLVRLMRKPNPTQRRSEFLRTLTVHKMIAGNAYIHKIRSQAGIPVQMWLLRPDRISVVPGEKGFIEKYEYGPSGNKQDIPARDVIHIMDEPDPLNDFYGLSRVMVASRSGDLDNQAADYLRSYFLNGARPLGLISLAAENVPKEEKEKVQAEWKDKYGGLAGWFHVAVFGGGAKYQALGADVSDLKLEHVFSHSETRLCAAFGVPPILVASWIGLLRSTMANYREARKSWWEDRLTPEFNEHAEIMTEELALEFGPDLAIESDVSQVPAFQENQEDARKYWLSAWRESGITKNEFREKISLPRDRNGDVYRVQANQLTEEAQIEEGVSYSAQTLIHGAEAHLLESGESWAVYHSLADRKAPGIATEFVRAAQRAQRDYPTDEMLSALKNSNVPKVIELLPVIRPKIQDGLLDLLLTSAEKAGEMLPQQQKANGGTQHHELTDAWLEQASWWVQTKVGDLIVEIESDQKLAIRALIMESFEEGITPDQINIWIRQHIGLHSRFSAAVSNLRRQLVEMGVDDFTVKRKTARYAERLLRSRSRTIAATETITSSSMGQQFQWRQAASEGLIDQNRTARVWIVTPDDKLCPICAPLDGAVVGFEEQFQSSITLKSGEVRQFTSLTPTLHPNCRCAMGLKFL